MKATVALEMAVAVIVGFAAVASAQMGTPNQMMNGSGQMMNGSGQMMGENPQRAEMLAKLTAACVGKSEESDCIFTSPDGKTAASKCEQIREKLLCVPPRRLHHGGQAMMGDNGMGPGMGGMGPGMRGGMGQGMGGGALPNSQQ